MKKTIIIAIVALLGLSSCKKQNVEPINPIKTPSINYYDTVGTGKRFIDIYVTNTTGVTKIFVNSEQIVNVSGSYVKALVCYNNDTIKVQCANTNPSYSKIYIRKNYTAVVDTSTLSSTLFISQYIVH